MTRSLPLVLVLAGACTQAAVAPLVPGAHADPAAVAAATDGSAVFVSCPSQRAIASVDLRRRRIASLRDVGGRAAGLALSPDGRALAVTLRDEDRVRILDAGTLAPRADFPTGFEPVAAAYGAQGRLLFVANARGGDVWALDAANGAVLARVPAGREPYALAASPDGARVAAVSRRAEVCANDAEPRSLVTLLDGRTGALLRRADLVSCHLAESLAFTRDGARVLVPVVRVRNLLPIVQVDRGWVMSTVLATVDPATGAVAYLPLCDPEEGFADPTGIALAPDGARAFVASRGADRVAEVRIGDALALEDESRAAQPERLGQSRAFVTRRFDVGAAPSALAASGDAVVVAERLGDSVAAFAGDGRLVARIALVPAAPDEAVRRGDRVFHDARYAFQSAFSCSSCHPGGHTDGLVYDFEIDGVGRNLVLNRSLLGVRGTAPFKWTGRNASLAEQCGPRFAKVLTRAEVFPPQDLEDVVAYLESLPPPRRDPRAAPERAPAVARGRALFERTHRRDGAEIPAASRCVSCHPAPLHTDLRRSGVGTQALTDDTGTFDAPHLTALASKAPFLHDGRAATLASIWTSAVGDLHGVVSDLRAEDLADLVAFLESL